MDSTSPKPAPVDVARPGRGGQDSAPPALRASDQERDEVAAVLGDALAAGRLTSTEHAERIEAAYAARTLGELTPLTADLPADRPSNAPAAMIEHQQVTATFSKVHRGGRWVAGRHTELRSTFGALIVDMSEAVLPGREIVLEANSFCGKLIVTVPANARIVDEGGVLFGKRLVTGGGRRKAGSDRSAAADSGTDTGAGYDEDGPLIRVTGQVRFGKVIIHRAGNSEWRWPWRAN